VKRRSYRATTAYKIRGENGLVALRAETEQRFLASLKMVK